MQPQVDGGRFPAKRTLGDTVVVEADMFCDGHDELTCVLLHRHADEDEWRSTPMEPLGNDRWRATFEAKRLGEYVFRTRGWVDPFKTWRHDLRKRLQAGQDVSQDLLIGAELVEAAAERADPPVGPLLSEWATLLRNTATADAEPRLGGETAEPALPGAGGERSARSPGDEPGRVASRTRSRTAGVVAVERGSPPLPRTPESRALSPDLAGLVALYPDTSLATEQEHELRVFVDRPRARFSSWYELFPRSTAEEPGRHGTFADVERLLPYVSEMGFDVLYLPPIHPIGRTNRKGPNNAPEAGPDDPGSPWGIGAAEGGHKAVHPELGTMADFRRLVTSAEAEGIEVALDIALQCSPDHPYVEEHPEWFRKRPDGSIQYAENPPKKYQDIYPFDFETEAWPELWEELASIFFHWIDQGVRIFRVDNPHTKPFDFWEWTIARIRSEHPDVIFLSEAFTRPKVMYRLAKLGFTQSYTYFAWRNGKRELRDYVETLTTPPVRDFFRPNFWPNTPDILTEYLQTGHRPGFMIRLVLAATLSSSYGIYGPAFELLEDEPREPGSEEYLDSEKYEIRDWDLDHPDSLRHFIARMNRIRRDHAALQATEGVHFHATDNEELIAYSKATEDGSSVVLTVVSLDPHHTQSGWLDLDLEALGVGPRDEYLVHDLLGGERFLWHGSRSFVRLDPQVVPAHVFHVSRRARTEQDFEYYI